MVLHYGCGCRTTTRRTVGVVYVPRVCQLHELPRVTVEKKCQRCHNWHAGRCRGVPIEVALIVIGLVALMAASIVAWTI